MLHVKTQKTVVREKRAVSGAYLAVEGTEGENPRQAACKGMTFHAKRTIEIGRESAVRQSFSEDGRVGLGKADGVFTWPT